MPKAALPSKSATKFCCCPITRCSTTWSTAWKAHTVTLSGYVTSIHATTKSTAENVVKHIEGVDKVVNNIEVLPPLGFDQEARARVYRSLVSNRRAVAVFLGGFAQHSHHRGETAGDPQGLR